MSTSNTSPLRDESQLTDEQISDIASDTLKYSADKFPSDEELRYFARALLSRVGCKPQLAEWPALEAEVRSLRSQGKPVAWAEFDGDIFAVSLTKDESSPYLWIPLYTSPPSQPIASDVVAGEALIALFRDNEIPLNDSNCRLFDVINKRASVVALPDEICRTRSAEVSGPVHCGDSGIFCENCPRSK